MVDLPQERNAGHAGAAGSVHDIWQPAIHGKKNAAAMPAADSTGESFPSSPADRASQLCLRNDETGVPLPDGLVGDPAYHDIRLPTGVGNYYAWNMACLGGDQRSY